MATIKNNKTLSPRTQLEGIVRIHLLALKTFLTMDQIQWGAYIKIANNNGKTIIALEPDDYVHVQQNDDLLSILNNVTVEITNQVAMQLKINLIRESEKQSTKHSPRDALLYMEIEDCIKSLQNLTGTTRTQTKLTGPLYHNWTTTSTPQLLAMRACLEGPHFR